MTSVDEKQPGPDLPTATTEEHRPSNEDSNNESSLEKNDDQDTKANEDDEDKEAKGSIRDYFASLT